VKTRLSCVLLFLWGAALPALAQADAPPTRDEILGLFGLMHVREQVVPAMESIAKQQRAIILDNLRRQNPHIRPQDMARLNQFTTDIMSELPVEGMIDDMVPVYQKHLNRSDVEAMSAFYSSPAGQKLVREMPAMTLESMQAASPRIQAFMDKVMERAQAMAKDKDGQEKKTPRTK
jgi:uncharacterized protein